MRNILITAIGGDVACAIIRCLLDVNVDDRIYGIDTKVYTPYMNNLAGTFVAPGYTQESYTQYIRKLVCDLRITHFLPTTEQEIVLADKDRKFFAVNNVKLLINNRKIIEICTSKYKTAQFLKEQGIAVPATYRAPEYKGELGYPFVLKADVGCGSKLLKIIHNENEWLSAEKNGMVCQRLIGNAENEFTAGVFCDGNEVRSIIFRRKLGFGGLSAIVECHDVPEITDIAAKTAKVFGLKGCFNIQFRKDNGQYYIFEINPRLSSTTGFRHKFGFMDAVWWFDLLDGKGIPAFENKAVGRMGIKVLDDIVLNSKWGGVGQVEEIDASAVAARC